MVIKTLAEFRRVIHEQSETVDGEGERILKSTKQKS